jgi:hypothetical protein
MYFFDPWFGIVFLQNDADIRAGQPTAEELRNVDRYLRVICAGIVLLMSIVGGCILET